MNALKSHIISKITVRIIAILLLLPSAVKFTHAFNHYKHEVCLGEKSTHLHKVDLNCKFYDFKLTNNYVLSDSNFNVFIPKTVCLKSTAEYVFLNTYQQLHFSLRGPPVLG